MESAATQEQEAPARGGSVQVGVPRAAKPGRVAARPGPQNGPPPKPAPRRRTGKILTGWSDAGRKGRLAPGRRRRTTLGGEIPFQPWARPSLNDRQKNQLEPHTRASRPASTRQFPPLRTSSSSISRNPAGLHLRYRRAAHVSDYLHGRADPLRKFAPTTTGTHRWWGRRHTGRRPVSVSTRASDRQERLSAYGTTSHA